MGKKKKSLVRRIAEDVISSIDIHPSALDEQGLHIDAQDLYQQIAPTVYAKVAHLRHETLGRIAAQGKGWGNSLPGTSLYIVHCGTWLNKHADGLTLLHDIAVTTIIAKMVDILEKSVKISAPSQNPKPETVRV